MNSLTIKMPKSISSFVLILSLFCSTFCQLVLPLGANGQSVDAIYKQASALEAQGQYQQALQVYTNAINYNPRVWNLYFFRGFVFFNMGMLVDAGKDFEAAGTLNPNEAACYMARGMAFNGVGDYQSAMRDMNTAIAKSPREGKYYFQRGYLYSVINNPAAALDDLSKAASLRTTNYERAYDYAARSVVYARNSQYDMVEPEVSKALEIFDSSSRAEKVESAALLSECALARCLKSDFDGCRQVLNVAAQITPMTNLTRSRNLAVLCLLTGMQGNTTEAQTYANQAYALAPNYKWVYALCNTGIQMASAKNSGGTMVATQPNNQDNFPKASGTTTTTTTQTPSHTTTTVSPQPTGNVNRPVEDKWALVVGISKFSDGTISKLKYSAKDAKDFAEFLVTKANFKRDHVRLLLNEQATQRRIIEELGDKFLPRVVGKNDLVVFYFSSHGSPAKADDSQKDRMEKAKNYLVAYDTSKTSLFASGINVNDLTQLIKDRVDSDRVVVILDACHSGAADANAKDGDQGANFNADQLAGQGQMVICSSKSDERSWESKRYANGVFTKHLMEALGQKSKLKQAFEYMEQSVSQEVKEDEAARQTPVLKSQWDGADLSLLAQPFKPRPFPNAVRPLLQPDSLNSAPAMVPNRTH